MSVDVFGRKLEGSQVSRGPPGIGFNFTLDGNFDIENKRLCNVGQPSHPNDAISLNSLKVILQSEVDYLSVKIGEIAKVIQEYEEKVEKYRSELDAKLKYLYDLSQRNFSAINYMIKELNNQLHVSIVDVDHESTKSS